MNIFRANIRPGDVGALTAMEFEILLSLSSGPLHGYAIIQDIAQRSDNTLTVRPGTLYRAIARLLEAGILSEVEAQKGSATDDPRRRYYAITPEGRRVASLEARRLARQVDAARARRLLKDIR